MTINVKLPGKNGHCRIGLSAAEAKRVTPRIPPNENTFPASNGFVLCAWPLRLLKLPEFQSVCSLAVLAIIEYTQENQMQTSEINRFIFIPEVNYYPS